MLALEVAPRQEALEPEALGSPILQPPKKITPMKKSLIPQQKQPILGESI